MQTNCLATGALSHSVMVYCTLKWFSGRWRLQLYIFLTPVHSIKKKKKRTEGAFLFNETALGAAYHPCDHALWWLHHTGCGLWGIDSSLPNLMGSTSYLVERSVCDFVRDPCAFLLLLLTQHCGRQTLADKWRESVEIKLRFESLVWPDFLQ